MNHDSVVTTYSRSRSPRRTASRYTRRSSRAGGAQRRPMQQGTTSSSCISGTCSPLKRIPLTEPLARDDWLQLAHKLMLTLCRCSVVWQRTKPRDARAETTKALKPRRFIGSDLKVLVLVCARHLIIIISLLHSTKVFNKWASTPEELIKTTAD